MKRLIATIFATTLATGAFAQAPGTGSEPGGGPGAGGSPGAGPGAAPSRERQERTFDVLDQNGDGKLSQEEAEAAGLSSTAFDSLDKDGNGELSKDEFMSTGGGGMR